MPAFIESKKVYGYDRRYSGVPKREVNTSKRRVLVAIAERKSHRYGRDQAPGPIYNLYQPKPIKVTQLIDETQKYARLTYTLDDQGYGGLLDEFALSLPTGIDEAKTTSSF